jgi:hypothetical protein
MPAARPPWPPRAWACAPPLFTLNLDLIAQMSCNPAVGGIAKGHLVREIDALGGIMGEVADACRHPVRLLNTSAAAPPSGAPARSATRRSTASACAKCSSQPNLFIKQAEVVDVVFEECSGESRFVRGFRKDPSALSPAEGPEAPHHRRSPARWPHTSAPPPPSSPREHSSTASSTAASSNTPPAAPANPPPCCWANHSSGWPARLPPEDRNAAAPRWPHHRLEEVSRSSPAMPIPRPSASAPARDAAAADLLPHRRTTPRPCA